MDTLPIYTIGDSHSRWTFVFDDDESTKHSRIARTYRVGAITMHRVGRDTLSFSDYSVPKDGIVISCFGEIDIRCHIERQRQAGRDEDAILRELVDAYMVALEHNRKNGYKYIAVMNVVPVLEYAFKLHSPHIKLNLESGDPSFPYLGTNDERKRYTYNINNLLHDACKQHNFGYLDVYNCHVNENGYLRPEYSDGICHIRCFKFTDRILDSMIESFKPDTC